MAVELAANRSRLTPEQWTLALSPRKANCMHRVPLTFLNARRRLLGAPRQRFVLVIVNIGDRSTDSLFRLSIERFTTHCAPRALWYVQLLVVHRLR